MATSTRRQWAAAFTVEAVGLMRDLSRPVAPVARELGMGANLRSRWQGEPRQAASPGCTRPAMRIEQAELTRLRRENATLRKEQEGVKPAAVSA